MEKLTGVQVHGADGAEALARAAAEEVTRAAEAAVREHGRFTIALSGGGTPKPLHRLLADPDEPFRARLPWERIHFFWGDERHVPPDHADSNYRMARETLLDDAPVPAGNVHRMRAEEPAAAAAAAYERELRDFFAPPPGELPRFDLLLMGLGPDGHTASIFPGTPVIHETERWVAAPWVEAHHTFRITLTPPVLNAAARVLFLVSGAEKAAAVRDTLEGPRDVDRHPAQVIAPARGTVLWLLDRAAASQLGDTRS